MTRQDEVDRRRRRKSRAKRRSVRREVMERGVAGERIREERTQVGSKIEDDEDRPL